MAGFYTQSLHGSRPAHLAEHRGRPGHRRRAHLRLSHQQLRRDDVLGLGDPIRFAGKELDPETGQQYFDARYYRSTWGQFSAVDPLHVRAAMTDPQQWNRYACPSPSGSSVATYWARSGGGAACWVEQVLTVLPASETPDLSEASANESNHGAWFRRARTIDLSWTDDDTLTVGFPASAVVLHANPGGLYTPKTPNLQLRYQSLPANSDGDLVGGNRCSGTVALPATR